MVTHAKSPGMAHQALVDRVHATLGDFAGLPKIEQIAMLGQVIGHLIAELPANSYGPGEVLQAVAANIASGNQQTARGITSALHAANGRG